MGHIRVIWAIWASWDPPASRVHPPLRMLQRAYRHPVVTTMSESVKYNAELLSGHIWHIWHFLYGLG